MSVEGPSTRPIPSSMILWSYSRRRRHLTILIHIEIKLFEPLNYKTPQNNALYNLRLEYVIARKQYTVRMFVNFASFASQTGNISRIWPFDEHVECGLSVLNVKLNGYVVCFRILFGNDYAQGIFVFVDPSFFREGQFRIYPTYDECVSEFDKNTNEGKCFNMS